MSLDEEVCQAASAAPDLQLLVCGGTGAATVAASALSDYKVPRAVYLAERIQRSPAGKADYRRARDYALSSRCELK